MPLQRSARRAFRRSWCTSRRRRTSIVRSWRAGDFIRTDVEGTFVLLEAARRATDLRPLRADLDRRGVRQRGDRRERRDGRTQAAESRTPRARRARIAWPTATGRRTAAGRHHARLEQLRAVPVSREGHPALRDQRDRRHPGAALRRRQERARLAARARSLPRPSICSSIADRRRGLQHRRRQRGHERRPHAPHPRRARQATLADHSRRRSPGHDRRYCLDTTKLRELGWTPHVPFDEGLRETVEWYRRTSGGGGRSRSATLRSAPTTRPSTSSGSGRRPSSDHRCDRLRRQSSRRASRGADIAVVAWTRRTRERRSGISRVAAGRPARSRSSASARSPAPAADDLPLRGRPARRGVVARHHAAARRQRARDVTICSTRLRRAALRCRVLVTGPLPSTRHRTRTDQRVRRDRARQSVYALSKLAQEQLALRAIRRRRPGCRRWSRALQSHRARGRPPAFVAPSMARQIALDRRGRRSNR